MTDQKSARQRILDVAIGLIAKRGSKALHVDDVVEQAGVGLPTFYRHFHTKERLVAEAQAATYISIIEALGDCVVRAETALDEIQRDDYLQAVSDKMVQIWAATQNDGRWRMVELLRDIWKVPETQRAFSAGVDAQIDRWTAVIERGQDLNWINPDLDARWLVMYCWSASLGQMIFSDSRYRDVPDEGIRRVFLFIIGASDWSPE